MNDESEIKKNNYSKTLLAFWKNWEKIEEDVKKIVEEEKEEEINKAIQEQLKIFYEESLPELKLSVLFEL